VPTAGEQAYVSFTDTFTGDGSTTNFTLTYLPTNRSEKVYVNDTLLERDTHYTINYTTGAITFAVAPSSGANITVVYSRRNQDWPLDEEWLAAFVTYDNNVPGQTPYPWEYAYDSFGFGTPPEDP
jgi:hypothetical protein